jgi:ABC-type uncharacterized transport system substrate-binding protein
MLDDYITKLVTTQNIHTLVCFIILILAAFVIFLGKRIYFHLSHKKTKKSPEAANNSYQLRSSLPSKQHKNNKRQTIAIVFPDSSPLTQKIIKEFCEILNNHLSNEVTFETYDGNGDEEEFLTQLDSLATSLHHYDLLFTIGVHATQLVKESTKNFEKKPPIVFTAVKNPDKLNIVDSFASSGNNLTGISGKDRNYELQADLLRLLKPKGKHILLLNDPNNPWKDVTKKMAEDPLQKKDFIVHSADLQNKKHIVSVVKPILEATHIDTIITMPSAYLEASIKSLVELCKDRKTTIFASNNSSAEAGAVFSYGKPEELYGRLAAEHALAILRDGKAPWHIPIKLLDTPDLFVCNISMLQQQGIEFSEKLLTKLIEGGR